MTTTPAPVQAAIDAANSGDTEAFLAAFTPETGFVNDWGREFRGHDAIRRWSDGEFIGSEVTLDVTEVTTKPDGDVVVIATVGGKGFNGPSTFTFLPEGDTLANMRITA